MLTTMEFLNKLIAENLPLFGLVGILGGIVMYWKNGGFMMTSKIIENFRMRVDQLEKDVVRLTASDTNKTAEIGRLNGVIETKNGQIDQLQAIITNRDPAMQKYLEENAKMLQRIEQFLEKIHGQNEKNEEKMDEQTSLLKAKNRKKK